MTPQQLMATGDWTRSGEWPHYQGVGPRYQHRTLDICVQGYATHRNSRRRGSRGITKMRVWHLRINGKTEWRDSRFALLADAACEYATGVNCVTGQPLMKVNERPVAEYRIAYAAGSGEWDVVDRFMALDDEAANAYAERTYTGDEWYVLDATGRNINGGVER